MLNDMEHMIKQRLLEDLIEKMSDKHGERLGPEKGMAVQVAAPDKSKLAEGLDKAKGILSSMPMDHEEEGGDEPESDEERLMELMHGEDDDDEDEEYGKKGY